MLLFSRGHRGRWRAELISELIRPQRSNPHDHLAPLLPLVRVIFAGNIFRLLGWMEGTDKLVLAHGFTKKTEKTPLQEIQITETRKKIYENKET